MNETHDSYHHPIIVVSLTRPQPVHVQVSAPRVMRRLACQRNDRNGWKADIATLTDSSDIECVARYWIVCLSAALVGSLTATAAWNFADPDPFAGFVGVASFPFTVVGAMILLDIRRALYQRNLTSGVMTATTVLAGILIGGVALFIFGRLEPGAFPMGAFYGFTTATALVAIVRLSNSTQRDAAKRSTG